jgi:hypothetical protein
MFFNGPHCSTAPHKGIAGARAGVGFRKRFKINPIDNHTVDKKSSFPLESPRLFGSYIKAQCLMLPTEQRFQIRFFYPRSNLPTGTRKTPHDAETSTSESVAFGSLISRCAISIRSVKFDS